MFGEKCGDHSGMWNARLVSKGGNIVVDVPPLLKPTANKNNHDKKSSGSSTNPPPR